MNNKKQYRVFNNEIQKIQKFRNSDKYTDVNIESYCYFTFE